MTGLLTILIEHAAHGQLAFAGYSQVAREQTTYSPTVKHTALLIERIVIIFINPPRTHTQPFNKK